MSECSDCLEKGWHISVWNWISAHIFKNAFIESVNSSRWLQLLQAHETHTCARNLVFTKSPRI
jgi:hypothetical protein